MGKSYLQTSGRAKVEHFVWEIPIYQLNLLPGGAFHVENFYLQTQLQRFVWEIPIYKLNWSVSCGKCSIYKLNCSVSCGKFLFTNSTGAFRVGNFYLQTQLQRFVWEIPIYKLNWSVSCGKFLFTNSTGAFRVGNFYLQTQLVCFPYLQTIFKLIYKPIYKPHS